MHRGRDHDSSSDPNRLPASSPTDECPVFADLSPLKPEKEGYVKRFSGTNYPYPAQLLTSDQHQETLSREVANSNVHVKEIRSCSPSGLSQECLANPVELDSINSRELGGNEIEYDGGGHASNPSDKLQNAGGGYDQPPYASNKTVDASQDYNISSTSESNRDAVDTNQNQHGIRRRLQFEAENDSGSIRRCNSYTFEKPTYDFGNLRLPASLFYCDTKQQGVCSSGQEVGHSKPSPFNSHPHPEIDRSTLNDVNSSKSALPISVSVGPNLKQASQYSHNYGLAASLSVAENNYVQMHGDLPENQNFVAATSVSLPSTHTMKPSNDSPCLIQAEQSPASCEESMSSRLEETDQVSSIRNRKRGAITSESKSCNHCNCERSKCLKLYCECFASETYCVDSCGCANCFNKPEYEDTVEEARQQIVSRNPHAFAPKVVVTASPIQDTSARRHKRGCNCKKSKCLKKYCECYQSGVGCSDGCRCDNCQNSFGTKTETIYWRVERCKDESREKLNTGSTNTDSVNGMGGGHLSSTRQGLDSTSNFTPLPLPCLETALSHNLWNYSQTQFGTDGSFHSQYPTNPFTQQQLYRNEVFSHDCEDASIQYTLPAPPPPIKAVKASSPNVSPPKFESQGLGSISLQSLRSGGKFSFLRAYTSCRNENESYDKVSSDDQ